MEDLPKQIHRFLISTTSRLVGMYDSPAIRIDHAWSFDSAPHRIQQGLQEDPYSRNYLVLSIAIEESKSETIVLPSYNFAGDQFCAVLSIIFGKRFDNHGPLFSRGFFQVPELGNLAPIDYPSAGPYSHRPRRDFGPPLNLTSFGSVAPLFTDEDLDEEFRRIFFAAARFYLRSLQVFDQRPEFAYLDLITCGEILSNYYDYDRDELFDQATKELFKKILANLSEGPEVVRQLAARMRQVKKRYTLTLLQLLTPSFFAGSECSEEHMQLKPHDIERRLKASYDLRSLYVHTGIEFDRWMRPSRSVNEIQFGKPLLPDKAMAKALNLAPTYFGLERVIRYCLLRFIHLHGVPISPELDSPTSS